MATVAALACSAPAEEAPAPAPATGPSTRPALVGNVSSDPWTQALHQFAGDLAAGENDATVRHVCTRVAARTFDGSTASVRDLLDLVRGADWARVMAYPSTPDALATDLAAAIAEAPVDESVRTYLTPSADLNARQANVTAIRWLAHALRARIDQPIGLILLRQPAGPDAPGSSGRLVLVVVAGETTGADRLRIRQFVMGVVEPPPVN